MDKSTAMRALPSNLHSGNGEDIRNGFEEGAEEEAAGEEGTPYSSYGHEEIDEGIAVAPKRAPAKKAAKRAPAKKAAKRAPAKKAAKRAPAKRPAPRIPRVKVKKAARKR